MNDDNVKHYYVPKEDHLFGKCTLQIRFENEEDYLEWQKYNGGPNRWDFLTSFPAIMKADYTFNTGADVDLMTRKVIQLLQMGFNVRAVDWRLAECQTLLEK